MQDLTAKRTLVKSPPELWSELSEVERLARHLGAFGEIKITRLEPERTVAWEGEGASGTVSIEPSGWGTKVVLTASIEGEEPPPPEPAPEAVAEESPDIVEQLQEPPRRKRRRLLRLLRRERPERALTPAADPPVWVTGAIVEEPPAVEPEPPAPEADDGDAPLNRDGAQAALESALEALGSAHHRPFSRG
jgi:hypothetical protein